MEKQVFEGALKEYTRNNPGNQVAAEIALRPDLAGMRIFEEPLTGYAAAGDPYFDELRKPEAVGPHFLAPEAWLEGAETVISLFFPFTERVRAANRASMDWPADEWLHARIEGQAFQNEICRFAVELLGKAGFSAAAPMIDPRFSTGNPVTADKSRQDFYSSNWSERHAAYACGLGTFGLSRGLITRRGIAGRFISLITSAPFEPDKRGYSGIYEYCIRCGACARNCPAGAISMEGGKRHPPCSAFLDTTTAKYKPRYGCGKCQVKVPCEAGIPAQRR
ncbi:MAG: 4Fe-4S binding protein [Treponema sp.]|jgi:epoxyqueuosine reductase QueG|nr:4Fe-4S binding protein [Treponema sp.]